MMAPEKRSMQKRLKVIKMNLMEVLHSLSLPQQSQLQSSQLGKERVEGKAKPNPRHQEQQRRRKQVAYLMPQLNSGTRMKSRHICCVTRMATPPGIQSGWMTSTLMRN